MNENPKDVWYCIPFKDNPAETIQGTPLSIAVVRSLAEYEVFRKAHHGLYGDYLIGLTLEQLQLLQNGEMLAVSTGEYTFTIVMLVDNCREDL